jgi:hypothetical protein
MTSCEIEASQLFHPTTWQKALRMAIIGLFYLYYAVAELRECKEVGLYEFFRRPKVKASGRR